MRKTVVSLICIIALGLSLSLSACAAGEGYADVPASAWYAEAVQRVSDAGLMVGTGAGRFSPDGTFTRAQLATVLHRLAGEPPATGADSFTDTPRGAWYADAVRWAAGSGLVRGYGDGRFGPNDPVTQEQLVTLLWRYAGEPEPTTTSTTPGASDYAQAALTWAGEQGLLAFSLAPREAATRAQVAALLAAFLQRERENMTITLQIDGQPVNVDWLDNETVAALKTQLQTGPLTVTTHRYGGFEQVGSLGFTLPRNDVETVTAPGDIVLYAGNQLVLFYGENTWAYTRLGRLTGLSPAAVKTLLNAETVTLTLVAA